MIASRPVAYALLAALLVAGCFTPSASPAVPTAEPRLAAKAPPTEPITVTIWDLPGARATVGPNATIRLDAPYRIDALCFVRSGAASCEPDGNGWRARGIAPGGAAIDIVNADARDAGRFTLRARIVPASDGGELLLLLREPALDRAVVVGVSPFTFDAYRILPGGLLEPENALMYRIKTHMPAHDHSGYGNRAPKLSGNGAYAGQMNAFMPGTWEMRLFDKARGANVTWQITARKDAPMPPHAVDLGPYVAALAEDNGTLRLSLTTSPSSAKGTEIVHDIAPGSSIALTFDGSWTDRTLEYHCHPHPEMTGEVRIEGEPVGAGETAFVEVRDHMFSPWRLVVRPGTTVIWQNEDPVTHNVHAPDPREELKGVPVAGASLWIVANGTAHGLAANGEIGEYATALPEGSTNDLELVGFVDGTPVGTRIGPVLA